MGKMKGCLILVFWFSLFSVGAQNWTRINELTYDAEYYFMIREYDKALKAYSQILKQLPNNANILYKLGVCYLLTETEKDKSIAYFIEAAKNINPYYNPDSYKEEGAPPETYFMLGSAYRVTNQLDKAIEAYTDYLAGLNPKDAEQKEATEHYIKACQNAVKMMGNPEHVELTSLGTAVNDEFSNFNAVISGDGNTLAYNTLKRDVFNILVSTKINGEWSMPALITRQVTSKNNFRTTGLSYDGTVLYLVEDDPFNSEIYSSTLNRGRWSAAQKLKKPVNSKMNETHASLSPDGSALYFTSNRSGGFGDLDIYSSKIDDKGKWSKPENLGPKINTAYNEETPFVSADGNRLYFSSEGHDGMGGYDIYYFNLHEPGSVPVNLGYPVNTTDNDLFFFPGSTKYEGVYSELESGGSGTRDIYRVNILPEVELECRIIPDNSPYFVDTGLFTVSLMDANTYSAIPGFRPLNSSGDFSGKITPGSYLLTVNAPGYEFFSKEITIEKEPRDLVYAIEANIISVIPEPQSVDSHEVMERLPEESLASYEAPEEILPEIVEESPKTELPDIKPAKPESNAEKIMVESPASTVPDKPVTIKRNAFVSLEPLQPFIDEVVREANDISSIPPGTPVTYTLQIYALRKPVDLNYLKNINGISVHYAPDKLFKYTWGMANDLQEAQRLKNDLKARGYSDVIIRRRAVVPAYTIQVMAGRNRLDFSSFNRFDRLKVTLGKDGYYRYTYGEYSTLDDARKEFSRLKNLGHENMFIRKIERN